VTRQSAADSSDEPVLTRLAGREPSPEFAAQVTEEFRRLLDSLADPNLEAVALWKLEGLTSSEIATKLGCVRCTVERRLALIRHIWEKEIVP
jgi:DNA-directed RNA polymerase specialized sigma24 family protein